MLTLVIAVTAMVLKRIIPKFTFLGKELKYKPWFNNHLRRCCDNKRATFDFVLFELHHKYSCDLVALIRGPPKRVQKNNT